MEKILRVNDSLLLISDASFFHFSIETGGSTENGTKLHIITPLKSYTYITDNPEKVKEELMKKIKDFLLSDEKYTEIFLEENTKKKQISKEKIMKKRRDKNES